MPNILHLLAIGAPRARVYAALTTADGVRSWWTRETELDTAVGGAGVFSFYGGRVVTRVRITALEPPAHLAWRVTDSTASQDWAGTTISFDLREDAAGTVLAFAHRGFAEENDNYARVTTGWAYFLVSLRQYLETGKGSPAPDVDFFRMTR